MEKRYEGIVKNIPISNNSCNDYNVPKNIKAFALPGMVV
ncbi:MAG: hypothetical protein MPEBLZ_01794 [Candidatus Methanoperedens nitroreducens]|uniref:Uncharacterized protein n=1 Tax=Candidatus Methanoperedens nitratireducens TaxID=1392998 RepID=A0A0P8E0C0_9EURY|nr:MAG: hypothetical protein MPEBLZ_01794 [Candidatus Methanoperedens sp. BLZ1]